MQCISGDPCCFIGDFNCVRDDSERQNCVYRRNDMMHFNDFINNVNLLELAASNATFTWFGSQGRKSKLDRVLVNHS